MAAVRRVQRLFCFSGVNSACRGVDRSLIYSLTRYDRVFSASWPRLVSTLVTGRGEEWLQPKTLSIGRAWQRYLSASSDEGSEEVLQWFDIDTPEFTRIVASYQEGKTTVAAVSLIDVREPEELVESGQVPGTINIPLGKVEEALSLEADVFKERYGVAKPTQDADVIFHCKAGARSLVAMNVANKLGFSRARHYVRGYLGWQDHMEKENN